MRELVNTLKKLIPYLKPYRSMIFGSALLSIPLSIIRLGPAPIVQYTMDDLLAHKDKRNLLIYPFFLIGIYVINFGIRFFHYYLMRSAVIRLAEMFKKKLFNHVLNLSADYFIKHSTGTLSARINSDPEILGIGLNTVNLLLREPITLCCLLAYAFYLNWKLTFLTIFVAPIFAWIFSIAGKNVRRISKKIITGNGSLLSTINESLTGIKVIKIFGLSTSMEKIFNKVVSDNAHFQKKNALIEELMHPMIELFTAVALAPVLYVGASSVLDGKMTTGELFGFFATFSMMIQPIRNLNDLNIRLHQSCAAAERVFDTLSWTTSIKEPKQEKPFIFEKSIRFENIYFQYPEQKDTLTLQNIHFSVKKGECIAIVGSSGAGKSSLMSLVPRLFDPTQGGIYVDNVDIRHFLTQTLRSHIAVVHQDIFLFNGTIFENIACGKQDATEQQVWQAAKRAYAANFIQAKPEGIYTLIGEQGQKLSGGEKQRIAIARAFLRQAPILILDEATSNLDSESEQQVNEAISDLVQEKTTFLIAHRLSTVKKADRILVLEKGKIIETGNHQELIKQEGKYAKFSSLLQL